MAPLPGHRPAAGPRDWMTDVRVDSADATADAGPGARAAGSCWPSPMDWTLRRSRWPALADPGRRRASASPSARRRAERASSVNEPGAWAMSAAADTPDAEGAAAFYGAVFGWTRPRTVRAWAR